MSKLSDEIRLAEAQSILEQAEKYRDYLHDKEDGRKRNSWFMFHTPSLRPPFPVDPDVVEYAENIIARMKKK